MGRKFFSFISVFFLATATASGAEKIPHVSPEMEDAGYWIERLPEPDQRLLSPRQIENFNRESLLAEPTAVGPLTLGDRVSASFFLRPIEEKEISLLEKFLFDHRGKRVGFPFFNALREKANLKNIPELIPVRFSLVVEECSLRTFPTMAPVVEEQGKLAFDLFQETSLHPGTPVAILWESRDGEWLYLVSTLLRGWAQRKYIAIFEDSEESGGREGGERSSGERSGSRGGGGSGKEGLVEYLKGEKVVVTEPHVPFYHSPIGEPIGEWVMGTVLHTSSFQEEGSFYRFKRPIRDKSGKVSFVPVYVPKEMVHRDFLPLTSRQMITQAFKLNGAPYGWGGLHGGWDCSSFLRDVFLTMGVELPRNSLPQSKVGKVLGTFSKGGEAERKKQLLDKSTPGATFVKIDGHIMLYLGKEWNRHYVIHSIAGYKEKGKWYNAFREKRISTFRVLVSDMELGKGGGRGSLLERTLSINAPFE